MKSAYEIAMQKLQAASGPSRKLTEDQKARLAEMDRVYDAKVAEIQLSIEQKIAAAAPEDQGVLGEKLTSELARLHEKREHDKDAVWNETAE